MKKLLGIVVLSLLLSGNAYAHSTNQFSYLLCERTVWNDTFKHSIKVNLRKKIIDNYSRNDEINKTYEIYETSETWIKAKNKENENKRIIIHRYMTIGYLQDYNKVEDKWEEEQYGYLECKLIKKKI